MANDEVKQRILGWCTVDDNLQLISDHSDLGGDFTLDVRTSGASPADLRVSLPSGADRIVVRHMAEIPGNVLEGKGSSESGSFEERLSELAEHRPGNVSAGLAEEGGRRGAAVEAWVYIDGLTKQSFMIAVSEVTRTRRALDRLTEELGGRPTEAAGAGAGAVPAQSAEAQSMPMPIPTPVPQPSSMQETPAYQPSPMPSQYPLPQSSPANAYNPSPAYQQPQPYAQSQQQPQQGGGWGPTHKVPGQGMQAWAAPDPNGAIVANLGGNLPVQVTEMRGAWAHVVCSNGWTGWVDGRLLAAGA